MQALSDELALPFPSALLAAAVKLFCAFACPQYYSGGVLVGVACLFFSVVHHTLQKCFVTLLLFSRWNFSKVLGLYQQAFCLE